MLIMMKHGIQIIWSMGIFFNSVGVKTWVNFAKNQKVNENCSAKQTSPEFPSKTFASWLPKFATEIKI